MVTIKKFESIEEIQELQKLSCKVPEDVFIHSQDDSVMVDAKSFIGLFTLDFSKPVKVVSESEYIHKELRKEE
ncbi:hypothetical protein [Solibaculum mannosilyticum]|uniref:Uncharacterized protein n=1 Tax=Solibaculum mannosilyticum TaxID=2780922 RepID=A0A7I8D418_9FIRM|nr:hypothetical protein [Solibaculum mannosilyticum]BCI61497.1 hypothetical protein C12CBH8_21360 [Solibaculum mannosilyticum]CZT55748.1 hypothetical protein BN3661_00830 [Eubacteriaceae bacterium CHKCI005]